MTISATFDIAEFLSGIDPKRIEVRRRATMKARQLIEARTSDPVGFSEEDLRVLFDLLATDYHDDRERRDRFGPGFRSVIANRIVENLDGASEAIRILWQSGDDDDSLYQALEAFHGAGIAFAGNSLPTTLLHVKHPSRFFPFMRTLSYGYAAVTGQERPRGRSSTTYRRYVEGVRGLVDKHDIPPELVDAVLAAAHKQTPVAVEAAADKVPPRYEFEGFSADAFAFLAELRVNNRQDWYRENRGRFKQDVDRPLRALINDLGTHFVGPLDPELETTANSHRTISKLRKNIYGKRRSDCYHTHFWGAFYRSGRTRSTDAQLFVTVFPDRLECGFYIGTGAEDVRQHFVEAVRRHPDVVDDLLTELDASDDTAIAIRDDGDDRTIQGQPISVRSAGDLIDAFTTRAPRIGRTFEPTAPVVGQPSLVDEVWATFEKVYPFFLLATSATPAKAIEAFRAGRTGSDGGDNSGDEPAAYDRSRLFADTFLTEAELSRIEALLADKRQIIFHGPPGTGKTYVGERIGRYLAGAHGDVKVIQFHPSYAYEDFVEGIRPGIAKGGLELDVHDGVFKRFCDAARQSPNGRFVLIVDEINRGNLPRIFGELLYLLENRGSKVDLPYSKRPFTIPNNVYVIGTMNTADHSIALVDFALRRRFHFVYFAPRPEILRAWLDARHPEMMHVTDLFERLNERLLEEGIEKELLIGHSHFMRSPLDESRLELIWEHTVEPLLEEYFYGRAQTLEAFQYEAFVEEVEDAQADVSDFSEPALDEKDPDA